MQCQHAFLQNHESGKSFPGVRERSIPKSTSFFVCLFFDVYFLQTEMFRASS